jgi:hypothetical protein
MANRRDLKKAIHQIAGSLFTECIMYKEFIPGTDNAKTDQLLDEILSFEDEFLRRVSGYSGKENPAVVRRYFKKLSADVVSTAHDLFDKIGELNK